MLTILKFEKNNELIVLWTSGLNKIHIQKLQRAGNSVKNRQEIWPFDLIDKRVLDNAAPNPFPKTATTMQHTPPPQNYAQQVHTQQPMAPTGLMGHMGLSMPDIMSMNTAKEQLPEVKRERDEWKEKCKELETENKRLERENLKYELGIEGKPGALEQLLNMVAENPSMIGEIVGAAKVGKTAEITEGLTGPQTDNPTKNSFIKVICDPRFTEEDTIICYNVGKSLASGDEVLKNKIKKHFNPQPATQDA